MHRLCCRATENVMFSSVSFWFSISRNVTCFATVVCFLILVTYFFFSSLLVCFEFFLFRDETCYHIDRSMQPKSKKKKGKKRNRSPKTTFDKKKRYATAHINNDFSILCLDNSSATETKFNNVVMKTIKHLHTAHKSLIHHNLRERENQTEPK